MNITLMFLPMLLGPLLHSAIVPTPNENDPISTVNLQDRNSPATWSIEAGKQKNIKWVVKLGSQSFGRPVVADGKIFVGTNNDSPRDAKIQGNKGVLMCFRESDGQFLWQAVHEALRLLFSSDRRRFGVCSAPAVEGNRLYHVSNSSELLCDFLERSHTGCRRRAKRPASELRCCR